MRERIISIGTIIACALVGQGMIFENSPLFLGHPKNELQFGFLVIVMLVGLMAIYTLLRSLFKRHRKTIFLGRR
jgi:hypothetical protein